MVVQCVGAILIQAETLLLGRRASHLRSYPTAGISSVDTDEAGETFERTLVREVKEEIGVTPVDFAKLISLQFVDASDGVGEIHIYRVDAWTGGPLPFGMTNMRNSDGSPSKAACALPNLASAEYPTSFEQLANSGYGQESKATSVAER